MAYAAVRGGSGWGWADVGAAVPWQAWALLASNLFWVLAYDTEYAMVDRDDDLKIGIKTSAITLGRFDVVAVMGFYAAYLVSWGLLGASLGLGLWFVSGLALAAGQVVWHHRWIRERTRDGCFRAFRLNHWLGFAVFAGAVVDLAVR
jgi:4-hydroxybenzoate polyprenyltransferase